MAFLFFFLDRSYLSPIFSPASKYMGMGKSEHKTLKARAAQKTNVSNLFCLFCWDEKLRLSPVTAKKYLWCCGLACIFHQESLFFLYGQNKRGNRRLLTLHSPGDKKLVSAILPFQQKGVRKSSDPTNLEKTFIFITSLIFLALSFIFVVFCRSSFGTWETFFCVSFNCTCKEQHSNKYFEYSASDSSDINWGTGIQLLWVVEIFPLKLFSKLRTKLSFNWKVPLRV